VPVHLITRPPILWSSTFLTLSMCSFISICTSVILTTPGVTIHNEYKTEVRDGGCAAIGPGGQVHVGDSVVTSA